MASNSILKKIRNQNESERFKNMAPDRESKVTELNRLYDLFWRSSSALDKALLRAKIGMVSAELAEIEITDTSIARTDQSGTVK
jgi:hypothetical protein